MPVSSERQADKQNAIQAEKVVSAAPQQAELRGTLASKISAVSTSEECFADDVRKLAHTLGGEYLFDLPASGLAESCQRIAAIQLPLNGNGLPQTEFILLDKDGENLRLRTDRDRLKDLEKFSATFIDVLGHIGPLNRHAGPESKTAN